MEVAHESEPNVNFEADLGRRADELTRWGISRREVFKFCAGVASTMGLSAAAGESMAATLVAPARPPVIWLHGQECTGCTESLLRANHPTVDSLILEMISLDYHETLCAGAGEQALAYKRAMMEKHKGKYVLVTEGGTPMKDGGIYCKVGGKTHVEHVREAAAGAAAVIAVGSCASWGGIQSADPNPTGAVGTHSVLSGTTVINIPGCPPSPYNFLSTVLYLLTFKRPPELDHYNRPKFAYGRLIHENCERRPHFDSGRFALEFGDEGHRKGYCLYKIGCKGPETYANCPAIGFGDVGFASWPVGTGHPCYGCTEKSVAFRKPLHSLAKVKTLTPPTAFPQVGAEMGEGLTVAAGTVAGLLGGLALGAGARILKTMGKSDETAEPNKED